MRERGGEYVSSVRFGAVARSAPAMASLVAIAFVAPCARAQTPPAAAFAALPSMESPALSADGKRIAFISHAPEGSYILVANVDGMAVTTVVDTGGTTPRGVDWASDDALVFTAGVATGLFVIPGRPGTTRPYGVDLSDAATVVPLLQDHTRTTSRGGGGGRFGGAFANQGAQLIGHASDAGRLLYPRFDVTEGERVLYSVDPKTDRQQVVDRGARSTRTWVLNEAGQPLFRVDYADRSNQFTLLGRGRNSWEVIAAEIVAIPELSVFGLDADDHLIIGARPAGVDHYGLYQMSTETGEIGAPMLTDDSYDITRVRIDQYTNRVVGGETPGQGPVWFDAELAGHQALLDESFPGESPVIVSWSEDRSRFIVMAEAADHPPAVYLYDAQAPSLDQIAATYTGLQGVTLPPRSPYTYTARDGERIPGYLTRPIGADGPTPAVILPHGGPASRDLDGFDWMAQFFASRGYTVLQPNFRGSGGYGNAWEMAGRGEWGIGVMQHDLSDGVAALIEDGLADASRVCIVGASYGGYAALAGAAFTPELYRCAAAIAPISDLDAMLGAETGRRGGPNATVGYWRMAMGGGNPDSVHDRLRAASPATHADQVAAPILLIHGRDDSVVPIEQSRVMQRALQEAGKPVELIELDGEDHWLSVMQTRLAALEAVERFLGEHLLD